MNEQVIFTLYGLFLIVGGFFGWKKGSKASLVAGIISGALVLCGAWWMSFNVVRPRFFLFGVTTVLSIVFLIRLIKTKKFMPSGMLLLVTVAMAIYAAALM